MKNNDECPECRGTGKISSQNCVSCGGSGEVIVHSHQHRHGDTLHDHPHPHPDPHRPADDSVAHEHMHTA
jgi:RecJ-like exonuclease